ncbi:MAG: hypothetical protein H6741_16525 [Alphaproteobacteria bacterium]|nr:hypothetical protein [Alphaproteobacteria bacterium]MCB9794321.1 hypothetical protein [Alphaproteobacteria bacterium]
MPGALGEAYLGTAGVDQWGTQWFYWFTAQGLLSGEGFGETDLFFYPWGKDIYAHTGANVLDAILAAPLRAWLGPEWGYNLFVLGTLVLNALAAAKLAREATDDPVAIGTSAILFALGPYSMIEVDEGRPTQVVLWPMLLFVLYAWRTGRQPGLRAPALAGLMLALSGLFYWFYAFFGGMLALGMGLARAAAPPEGAGGGLRVFLRYAAIAAVAALCVAPFAAPLAIQAFAEPGSVPGLLDVEQWTLFQVPPVTAEGVRIGVYTWQPLAGGSGFYVVDQHGEEFFNLTHLSFGPLELALLIGGPLAARGRDRVALVAVLLVGALLALGPLVVLGSHWYPNPVYIGIVKAVPFLRRLWWPGRGAIIIGLAGVLSAAWMIARLRERPALQALAVLLALGGLWQGHRERGLSPFPSWSSEIPAGYRCLAGGPPGALIELPYAWTQAHLYFQTAHGRPILGGMIEDNPTFSPPEATAFREDNSFIAALLGFDTKHPDAKPWTDADKQAVNELGYRYVVIQRDGYDLPEADTHLRRRAQDIHLRRATQLFRDMLGPVVWSDEAIAIYAPWGDPAPCEAPAR